MAWLVGSSACNRSSSPPQKDSGSAKPTATATATASSTPTTTAANKSLPAIKTRYPAAERVVAIGDVHGDFEATKRALKLAGIVNDELQWIAGNTVLVQTGDVLDRGDGEQAILDLFERLQKQAKAAGGAFHVLHGNHELMNVAGDMRYVTPGGWVDFQDAPGVSAASYPRLQRFPEPQRARYAAFLPGGAYAKKIASHPVVVIVGDTVFAHGGVLPKHVAYGIDRINREVGAWLLGRSAAGMAVIRSDDSPVWSRHFSHQPDEADCKLLKETLSKLGVKRMVVGHTVQKTIRPACDEQVWRIDVGMSAHYGGSPQALQLQAGKVAVLRQ